MWRRKGCRFCNCATKYSHWRFHRRGRILRCSRFRCGVSFRGMDFRADGLGKRVFGSLRLPDVKPPCSYWPEPEAPAIFLPDRSCTPDPDPVECDREAPVAAGEIYRAEMLCTAEGRALPRGAGIRHRPPVAANAYMKRLPVTSWGALAAILPGRAKERWRRGILLVRRLRRRRPSGRVEPRQRRDGLAWQ